MSSKIIISLKNVWVKYDQVTVLEDINLSVNEKEIVSIVGPNGGGKTTLLNTIIGFKEPFRGDVSVFDENPTKTERSGIIGYLPQVSEYDRSFPVNVFDVVALTRHARKSFGRKLNRMDKNIILSALENVGMADYKDHHFGSLSGGQQHRVLIARALAGEPRLLVLDEPSTGLDAVAQDAFYHTLHRIRDEQDITIIMVSHDIGTVSSVVDQIACLNKKIHFHGKPEGGIPSDALEETFGKHVHFLVHDEHCRTCEKRS